MTSSRKGQGERNHQKELPLMSKEERNIKIMNKWGEILLK